MMARWLHGPLMSVCWFILAHCGFSLHPFRNDQNLLTVIACRVETPWYQDSQTMVLFRDAM